jgi:hypothetical protein
VGCACEIAVGSSGVRAKGCRPEIPASNRVLWPVFGANPAGSGKSAIGRHNKRRRRPVSGPPSLGRSPPRCAVCQENETPWVRWDQFATQPSTDTTVDFVRPERLCGAVVAPSREGKATPVPRAGKVTNAGNVAGKAL